MNSCRSSRGPCTTVGDGRNDEARSPCLELRGALKAIQESDSGFRSTARAKFRVSKAVATWQARTLSTATRLFTNSVDNHMASVITARTTQARGAANQHKQRRMACITANP